MREQRHWTARFPVRFLAEIVVLVLLVAALVSYQFDLGERWFGWGPDPKTQPAAVAPPEGLKLPATGAARLVAGDARVRGGRSGTGWPPPCSRCCAGGCSAGTSASWSPT